MSTYTGVELLAAVGTAICSAPCDRRAVDDELLALLWQIWFRPLTAD